MTDELLRYWKIEYEIPPLRAIYVWQPEGKHTESEIDDFIKNHQPALRVRKKTNSSHPFED